MNAVGTAVIAGISTAFLSFTIAKLLQGFGGFGGGGSVAGKDRGTSSAAAAAAIAAVHRRRVEAARALGLPAGPPPELNAYEAVIAAEIVAPDAIEGTFDDIAGLEAVKAQLRTSVIMPLTHAELYAHSRLLSPPRGILFYGPPGTGKTLMAKALARQVQFTFISVNLSTLVDMYLGQSEKLGRAVFTLAEKLHPSIIFIDEVDALFGNRDDASRSTHQTVLMLKSEMMAMWDGMRTRSDAVVVLVGCTNRPDAIDPAFARRMPLQFQFPNPDQCTRRALLRQTLAKERVEPHFDYDWAANATDGYSCSDVVELCRRTVLAPVQEFIERRVSAADLSLDDMRLATTEDFREAMRVVRPRPAAAAMVRLSFPGQQ